MVKEDVIIYLLVKRCTFNIILRCLIMQSISYTLNIVVTISFMFKYAAGEFAFSIDFQQSSLGRFRLHTTCTLHLYKQLLNLFPYGSFLDALEADKFIINLFVFSMCINSW
jgi:hypothetical protein